MKTATRRRVAFWGVIGAVIVGALAVAMMPRAVPVDFAAVTRGRLTVTLDHEGKTRVRDRYVVSAPVAGRVRRIELRPGDRVVANRTVIATFLPGAPPLLDARSRAGAEARVSEAGAVLQQARAQREQARVQSEHAAVERNRAKSLAEFGLMTVEARQTVDAASAASQRALEAADAGVEAAEHEVEAARAVLVESGGPGGSAAGGRPVLTLRSPIDGVVLSRLQESEAVVAQGAPLVEVGDTAAIEVIADFLSTDAVRIKPRMSALIDQWGGSEPLRAIVGRVEPSAFVKVSALGVEEQRVLVVIDLEDPRAASQALGDGYRVEARVVVWERPDVVLAPTSSLFRRAEGWAVYVDAGGLARIRSVTVGQRNGTSAEILSGLRPGDRVVVYPPDSLGDGARITARAGGA
ncbi:MAG TPA: HlyD family efflux transporter periplasmic adaptor subunit [Vicinamibacterales bacterium]|jgi:HlyD family secretion protein